MKNKKANQLFNYEKLNERGLKPLVTALKRAGSPVREVVAKNRKRKVNGMDQKQAILLLENGQKITIQVGTAGDLIQVKLNATIIPITNGTKYSAIAKELSKAASIGQVKFDKSIARKLAKVKIDTGTKSGDTPVSTVLKETRETLGEVLAQNKQLKVDIQKAVDTNVTLKTGYKENKKNHNNLAAQEETLITELKQLTGRA